MEGRALAGLGLHPDAPAVAGDDAAADGEPDAVAGQLVAAVQALEHDEDALEVLGLDADAVVAHPQVPLLPLLGRADVDARRRGAAELEGVADQVLEELAHLVLVGEHRGKTVGGHLGSRQVAVEGGEHDALHAPEVDRGEGVAAALDARAAQNARHHAFETRGAAARLLEPAARLLAEAAIRVLVEQLEEALDLVERLAEVVRDDVADLLELGPRTGARNRRRRRLHLRARGGGGRDALALGHEARRDGARPLGLAAVPERGAERVGQPHPPGARLRHDAVGR